MCIRDRDRSMGRGGVPANRPINGPGRVARMRIGFLTPAEVAPLDWAQRNGFGSIAWNRFDSSGAGPHVQDWLPFAEAFTNAARARNLRISAIGALYKNPLDPAQSDFARNVFH